MTIIKGRDWRIYVGDVRQRLADIPAASVHCCITSPPYWGLRDYGTGQWEGGDPTCPHRMEIPQGKNSSSTLGHTGQKHHSYVPYKDVCGDCGAKRVDNQIGLEPLHDCLAWAKQAPPCGGCYVCSIRAVAYGVARALRPDGTFWLNLGDSYSTDPKKGKSGQGKNADYLGGTRETTQTRRPDVGIPNGNLVGIPWRVALALQADGWVLRSDIIWHKPSAMPESVKSRCSKAHEYVFMFAKAPGYYYDDVAIREEAVGGGSPRHFGKSGNSDRGDGDRVYGDDPESKNKRTVWTVATEPLKDAHFAPFPTKLIEPMILAGTSEHGCCSQCGMPYRRLTERTPVTRERPNEYVKRTGEAGTGNSCANTVAGAAIKTLGWEPGCRCDGVDRRVVHTPTGTRAGEDPSMVTGRAGYNRPRGPEEGRRPITRHEQARYAGQLKESKHRKEMENEAGTAFEHYIRTDDSGARPIPADLLEAWISRGWLEEVVVPPPAAGSVVPCTVLDPFLGTGTTVATALKLHRRGIGIELNPEYVEICKRRIEQGRLNRGFF